MESKPKKYTKTCNYCGKEFQTNVANKKYCNQYCSYKYRQTKQVVEEVYNSYKSNEENEKQTEITPINISGKQKFMGIEIPVIEGGFGEGQKVILAKTIAEIHGVDIKVINQLINSNLDEFDFSIDILDLKQVNSNDLFLEEGIFTKAQWGNAKNIYLLSEQGYHALVSIMRTDKAKQIRKQLRREYFTMRQVINQLSKEDKAWLSLKHSNQDKNAETLINITTQRLLTGFTKTLEKEINGEGRRITLSYLAKSLTKEIGIEIKTGEISNFLVYKGYLAKRYFQKITEKGELMYKYGTSIPMIESNAHRQPTNKFMDEFASRGLAFTKQPDIRGKIIWELTDRFEIYFKNQFLEEFRYYIQNIEKGWN